MKALFYLLRKQIKNSLLDLIRHPGRLILYIVLIASIGFSVLSKKGAHTVSDYLDIRFLRAGYLGILLLIGLPVLFNGLKSGATFFKMSDVNYVFSAPISPRSVLAYGMVKQMGTSILMIVFLLLYSGMLSDLFGLAAWQTAVLVVGIAVLLFVIQLLTLLIYGSVGGDSHRIEIAKRVVYVILGIAALYILFYFLSNGSNAEAFTAAVSSPYLFCIPAFGWMQGLAFGIIQGNIILTIAFSVLNVVMLVGLLLLFLYSNPDYYEDVLQSTETTFETHKAMREGRIFGNQNRTPKNIKVTDTGIGRGWGANTFFYKHVRQNKRVSRIPFLGTSTWVMAAVNIMMAVIFQRIGGRSEDVMAPGVILAICAVTSSYILFFFNMQGDWAQELMKPYIYLVPEKPFQKLVWASLSTLIKPAIDGILIFSVLCILVQGNPMTALLCALLYISMGFLYVSVNILSQRLMGQVANKGLNMIVYMLLVVVLFAPGAVFSGLLYWEMGYLPGFLIGLPMVVWNIAVSLGMIAACRNLLSTAEFNL